VRGRERGGDNLNLREGEGRVLEKLNEREVGGGVRERER